jgi:hypothetical protein
MDDTTNMKENKWNYKALLSTGAVMKLGIRPSLPPRLELGQISRIGPVVLFLRKFYLISLRNHEC